MEETAAESVRANNKKKQSLLIRIAHIIGNLVFVIILIFMSVMVFSLVRSKMTGAPPSAAGYQMYIVLSGSMGPTFDAGSVVFVRPTDPQQIQAGDIITYKGREGGETLTTHRVVEVINDGEPEFVTKGDANDVIDDGTVPAANIVGVVHHYVPYLGRIMAFTQTKQGLITLVFIPGILIIIFELKNLFTYAVALEEEKKAKKLAGSEAVENQETQS